MVFMARGEPPSAPAPSSRQRLRGEGASSEEAPVGPPHTSAFSHVPQTDAGGAAASAIIFPRRSNALIRNTINNTSAAGPAM